MEVARHWQMKNERYNLLGTTCSNCGRTTLGARPVCACEREAQPVYVYRRDDQPAGMELDYVERAA